MVIIQEFDVKDIDLNIARKLSRDVCEKYKVIPIRYNQDILEAVTCSNTIKKDYVKEYLHFIYNKEVKLNEVDLVNYEKIKYIIFGIDGEDLESTIIINAIKRKASDIHFEPKKDNTDIRYRINGSLNMAYKLTKDEYITLLSKIKLQANMDIAKKMIPQDGKIIFKHENRKYDLRVSTIPLIYGEKIVIRILNYEDFSYKLEDLKFSKEEISVIRKIIKANNGLIIVNGPTGSGKSTTLYTILKEINTEDINITTLEDPVEVFMPGINQMSLNKKLNINFSNGLRSILRQDPDVIMIGEIRDEETAKIAVRASITGHKVYSTIHTRSPREVYLRLENMGIKPYLIDESLVGIISQRLVRTLCKKCKIKDTEHKYKDAVLYKKCGCAECNYSGYGGRQLVSAVYYTKREGKNEIKNVYNDKEYLSNENMKKDLEKLLIDGEISYEDYIDFLEGEGLINEKS